MLHVWRDGGARHTGTGMVVAVVGTRLAAGRVRVHAQGRLLGLHSTSGYRERGIGVTLGGGDRNRTGLASRPGDLRRRSRSYRRLTHVQ